MISQRMLSSAVERRPSKSDVAGSNPAACSNVKVEDLVALIDDNTRLLRLPEVKKVTGMGTTQIYKLIRGGDFPAPVKLGPKHAVWISNQITDWQRTAIRRALMG